MLNGIYDDNQFFKDCQDARNSIISKSLRTGESGHLNRQLSYLMDDVQSDGRFIFDMGTFIISFDTSNFPRALRKSPKLGLYCVTAIIPELTQNVLDSSHTTYAGESYVNIVPELKKVLSLLIRSEYKCMRMVVLKSIDPGALIIYIIIYLKKKLISAGLN